MRESVEIRTDQLSFISCGAEGTTKSRDYTHVNVEGITFEKDPEVRIRVELRMPDDLLETLLQGEPAAFDKVLGEAAWKGGRNGHQKTSP